MKYKLLTAISLVAVFAVGCERDLEIDSVPQSVSIPEVYDFTNGTYVFGLGSNRIFSTIPDTLGIIVDSAAGFEGGFGGKTGKDSLYLLKSDVEGWPDTTKAGASSISVSKYSLNNYKNYINVTLLIVEPNTNPGPTSLEGTYKRTSNGFVVQISKISNGIFYLDNPGGAGVAPQPYVLKNFKDTHGSDSLAFAIQENPCGGGLQLITVGAPTSGVSSAEYSAKYPPKITSASPITLSWVIMEFGSATSSAVSNGGALCQWGLATRTFVKQ